MTMNTAEQLAKLLRTFKKAELPELQASAEAGDAQSQFRLGALYANGKVVEQDSRQAIHWLELAANNGWTAAQTLLGWLYNNADDIPKDGARAMEWYQRAAEAGDIDAQCALGDLYMQGGPGIEKNTQRMVHWYQMAANQNHPKAQYMLGKLLAEGQVLQQNDEAAFQWLTMAIMNESEAAQKELALLTARLGDAQINEYKQRMMEAFQARH